LTLASLLKDVRIFLLDIEGTTTPVDFVYQVLFPFARDHLGGFLQDSWGTEETREFVDLLKTDYKEDLGQHQDLPNWQEDPLDRHRESGENYATWLMAQDRKSTGLKALQGKIWERGYQLGELRGEVYPDVLSAFERWAGGGKDICIFSSGSILAQQLLFSNTRYGDLKPFIKRYFGTTTGSRMEAESYRKISAELDAPPSAIAFVSDVVTELDAVKLSGMSTVLCLRPGLTLPENLGHPHIETFDEISFAN